MTRDFTFNIINAVMDIQDFKDGDFSVVTAHHGDDVMTKERGKMFCSVFLAGTPPFDYYFGQWNGSVHCMTFH